MEVAQPSTVILRSLLFVPGHVERFIQRARASGADAICLDLEDSVPEAEKATARAMTAEAIRTISSGGLLVVRVNGLHTGMVEDDLLSVVVEGLSGIMLPKVEATEAVRRLDAYLTIVERQRGLEEGAVSIVPLVESARGILISTEIATASPRVLGLALGAEDLATNMGVQRTSEGGEIEWPRAHLAMACLAAGVLAVDTPETDYTDEAKLERQTAHARSLGYRGKLCVHPAQVPVVNRLLTPSEEEVAEAHRIVTAVEQEGIPKGRAAIAVDGRLIDTPIYWRAKRLVQWAEATGQAGKE